MLIITAFRIEVMTQKGTITKLLTNHGLSETLHYNFIFLHKTNQPLQGFCDL